LFLADNLVWVPLMDEIKQLFGISAASTLNNAEEEIESDEVESESSIVSNRGGTDNKIWITDNALYLIHLVEEYLEEFKRQIKKNIWLKVAAK
jgi:hypothetical protein